MPCWAWQTKGYRRWKLSGRRSEREACGVRLGGGGLPRTHQVAAPASSAPISGCAPRQRRWAEVLRPSSAAAAPPRGRKELVPHEMPGIIPTTTVAYGTDSPNQVADIDRTT
jgi:hypothetical protein